MDSTQVPEGINLGQWAGSRVLGLLFNLSLFGVLSMQVYLYYLAFPKDPLRNKVLVYATYILELTQTVIFIRSAFRVFGSGYGNWEIYNDVALTWFSIPFMTGIVAFLAEAFYAYRISVLARSYWWASIIILLASVQLGGAIGTAVVVRRGKLLTNLWNPSFYTTNAIWNGGSALCDIIIAACMIYYLKKRSSGSLESTKAVIQKLITLVIETGLATAAIALLNVILVFIPSHPPYFATPAIVLAKIYSNSMMVVLNSRMKVGCDDVMHGLGACVPYRPEVSQSSGIPAYIQSHGVMITREQLVSRDDRSDVTFSVSTKADTSAKNFDQFLEI